MMHNKTFSEIKSDKLKSSIFKTFIFVAFSLLSLRLWNLQIHSGTEFKKFSNRNRFKKQILLAPRGILFDRNKQVLSGNSVTSELKIHLHYVKDLDKALKKISRIINWPVEKIKSKIEQQKKKYGLFHPLTIKKHITLEEIYKIKLLHWEISGVYFQTSSVRTYPLKKNASQILGFTGRISKKEVKKLKQTGASFFPEEIIGKGGLEKKYNDQLKGNHGVSFVEVDVYNRITENAKSPFHLQNRESIKGKDLDLTLDKDIQEATFKAMKRKDFLGERKGSVIVMKTNGEILSWLSEPGFDPNVFSREINEDLWGKLKTSTLKSFLNKGLQEHYPPGSTLKPFIALAGLQEGLINSSTEIQSQGSFKLGRSVFHESSRQGYGDINVNQALEKSSNIFFYKLGLDLGMNTISKYLKLFGFGSTTGVDLYGELNGFVPTKKWKREKLNSKWQKGETLLSAIGQGYITSTLIQLAVAYNIIATEGLVVQPFLNKKNKPKILDTLTDRIDRNYFKTIKEGLTNVVKNKGGTAYGWRSSQFSFAGKTGTSQVVSLSSQKIYSKCSSLPYDKRHHGLFVSFAPAEKPEIIVAVLTEHSCSGSLGSVPVARDIISYYLKKYSSKNKAGYVSF